MPSQKGHGRRNELKKITNREKIMSLGLRPVWRKGIARVSVREVAEAAGVTLGSFSSQFASKAAFGEAVLDALSSVARSQVALILEDASVSPLRRIRRFLEQGRYDAEAEGFSYGLLFANFAHHSALSERERARLASAIADVETSVGACLRCAVEVREVRPDLEPSEIARFLLCCLAGANLTAELTRVRTPLAQFEDVLFRRLIEPHGRA